MEIIQDLKSRWDMLKQQNPHIRIRDAAAELQVSEADLLSTRLGSGVIRLNAQFKELLKEIHNLREVMALTRNNHCVHEKTGNYKKASFNGHVGLVVTPKIDLRLFMNQWHSGFAVQEGERKSFQFFNGSGEAVHKIYLTGNSDIPAYHLLTKEYMAAEQLAPLSITPVQEDTKPETLAKVPDSFREEWLALQDTHDFHPLLKKYGLSRTRALEEAPEGYAQQADPLKVNHLLYAAADTACQIMVFTGSKGCIQIHTGPVHRIVETGSWINVLDPDFNLHLRTSGIASLWLVKKPTSEGLVHSLEAYDQKGELIVQFFGKRKPGIPESENWRALLRQIDIL